VRRQIAFVAGLRFPRGRSLLKSIRLFDGEVALFDLGRENESQLTVENHSLTVTLKPHEIVTLRLVGEKMNR
jgi:hypothetical protein